MSDNKIWNFSHRKVNVKRRFVLFLFWPWHRCFPVNFAKFLRTPFSQNTSGRLLLSSLNVFYEYFLFCFYRRSYWRCSIKKINFKIRRHSQKSTCFEVNVLFVEVLQIDQAHLMDHRKLFGSLQAFRVYSWISEYHQLETKQKLSPVRKITCTTADKKKNKCTLYMRCRAPPKFGSD